MSSIRIQTSRSLPATPARARGRCAAAFAAAALFAVIALPATRLQAAEPAGQAKSVTGTVTVSRGGQTQPLAPGDAVFEQDSVATGQDSSAGITFRDNTILSLGPKAQVAIDRFAFDPAAQQLGLATRLTKGSFAMVTGQIAKLAPDRMSVTTPTATIGIRGTKFLVQIDE